MTGPGTLMCLHFRFRGYLAHATSLQMGHTDFLQPRCLVSLKSLILGRLEPLQKWESADVCEHTPAWSFRRMCVFMSFTFLTGLSTEVTFF